VGSLAVDCVRRTGNALLAAVLAPTCVACTCVLDAPGEGPACDACWARVRRLTPPLCTRCGHPLPVPSPRLPRSLVTPLAPRCTVCDGWPDGLLSQVRALGPYDGVLKDLVHALKYGARRSLAARLGPLLREAAGPLLDDADAAVPVPLHAARQWTRGFNQADLLARTLGVPVWPMLRRSRATPPQSGLAAAARRRNLSGAFRLRRLPAWRRQAVGRRLVLVDDVSTTGETLLACAAILRDAGAADVRAVVSARTVLEHGAAPLGWSVSGARGGR
jgi:ComF family protein